jgi:Zn-finger in ubiquitin-hydrolases and other protein
MTLCLVSCRHFENWHVKDLLASKYDPQCRAKCERCEECLKIGSPWVHLRICRTCGHVGCCDDSPNRHATKHFRATAHPIIEGMIHLNTGLVLCRRSCF